MQDISLYHTIASHYHHLRVIRTLRDMRLISYQIEQQMLRYRMPIEFYVGFQKFSSFLAQAQRYEHLASACQCLYVFGVPDVRPPRIRGIQFIELRPEMQLAHEWFLLVDTPEFWTLLSTRVITTHDSPTGPRCFEGIWTYDAPVVESASRLLIEAMNKPYQSSYERHLTLQTQNISDVKNRLFALSVQSD